MELTKKRWLMLKKIFLIRNSRDLTIQKLADILDYDRYNPTFTQLLSYLIDEEAIGIRAYGESGKKYLKINKNKVLNILKNWDIYIECRDLYLWHR
jgi:hypothetical protein